MTNDLHRALTRLVGEYGQIPDDILVRFDCARREWIDSQTRPVINFFLFAVLENTEKRRTNFETVRGNGIALKRMWPRRIDLHYMVSVLTTDVQDEHDILWRLLAVLMKFEELPREIFPEPGETEACVTARISNDDDVSRFVDIWGALGTPPHPSLHYVVTAPLDLEVVLRSPLVLTQTTRYTTGARCDEMADAHIRIGGTVRDKDGRPIGGVEVKVAGFAGEGSYTGNDGRFVLRGLPRGPVSLDVCHTGGIQRHLIPGVPQETYDITLDQ